MYCAKCGQELNDGAVACIHCGYATDGRFYPGAQPGYQQPYQPAPAEPDAPSAGFAAIGFFIPLVGLILYLIYHEKQPRKAKSAGKGALVGFIVGIVLLFYW